MSKGLEPLRRPNQRAEIRTFDTTIHRLTFSLRELHRLRRTCETTCASSKDPPDQKRDDTHFKASLLVPLFIDLSVVYLRRVADHFANSIRYALFGKFDGAVSPITKNFGT